MKPSNGNEEALETWIGRHAVDGVDLTLEGVEAGVWDAEQWCSVWIPIVEWDDPVADFSKSHCSCGESPCVHREAVWDLVSPLLTLVVPGPSYSTFWTEKEFPSELGPGASYLRERLQQLQDQARRLAWTELAYRIHAEMGTKNRD